MLDSDFEPTIIIIFTHIYNFFSKSTRNDAVLTYPISARIAIIKKGYKINIGTTSSSRKGNTKSVSIMNGTSKNKFMLNWK